MKPPHFDRMSRFRFALCRLWLAIKNGPDGGVVLYGNDAIALNDTITAATIPKQRDTQIVTIVAIIINRQSSITSPARPSKHC